MVRVRDVLYQKTLMCQVKSRRLLAKMGGINFPCKKIFIWYNKNTFKNGLLISLWITMDFSRFSVFLNTNSGN